MEDSADTLPEHRATRRDALARGAIGVLGMGPLAAALSACGGSGSGATSSSAKGPIAGTAVMSNYPGWMGKNVVKEFEAAYPKATIRQVSAVPNAESAIVEIIKTGDYDFALGDATVGGQAKLIGLLEQLDLTQIPNLKYVSPKLRSAFPYGIPTDQGKVGIGYRPDIVGEKITSWHDVWRLAPKFSGQVVFIDLDRDSMGSALKYLGYSANTHKQSEITACKNALIEIKPHLQAFLGANVGAGLVNGSTAIAMDWDFDVALNQPKQPKIEWVAPSEGMTGYLEGWMAIKGTSVLPVVEAFMNFALKPPQYADFVETTGASWVEPGVTKLIPADLANAPSLGPTADPDEVEFEQFLGDALPLWADAWEEVKASG
jgi:spermidine/putrescine-binding protein